MTGKYIVYKLRSLAFLFLIPDCILFYWKQLRHTLYSNDGLSSLTSQIFPIFPAIQFHAFFLSLFRNQINKSASKQMRVKNKTKSHTHTMKAQKLETLTYKSKTSKVKMWKRCELKKSQEITLRSFWLAIYCWVEYGPFNVVYVSSETPLEKAKISFASDCTTSLCQFYSIGNIVITDLNVGNVVDTTVILFYWCSSEFVGKYPSQN